MSNEIVTVFIEIAKGSRIKYEYDKEKKAIVCDRILHTPFQYEFNYGFIPNTMSQDDDPIDAVIIMDSELVPGCYIECKIIGFLETEDEAGIDPKLIMCPSTKVDPTYNNINDITDLPKITLEKIKYFFMHYKDLEHKRVTVGEFNGREKAIEIYKSGIVCQDF